MSLEASITVVTMARASRVFKTVNVNSNVYFDYSIHFIKASSVAEKHKVPTSIRIFLMLCFVMLARLTSLLQL